VTVHNVPPTVTAVADQSIDISEMWSGILATFTDPGVLDTHTAQVDWGDGTVAGGVVDQDAGTVSGSHAYTAVGVYTVTVTVTDNDGDAGNDSLQVTVVAEDIFEVNAGPGQEADEGSPVTFSGIITDTAGTGPYTIEWDFGDGNMAESSLTPSHTYADNGIYIVILTVTNSENQVATDTLTVMVYNVPPTVTAVADQSIDIGEMWSGILATFTDPGVLDTHTAVIDWGDGNVTSGSVDQAAGSVSGSHSYQAAGVYTVIVTVTDNDGNAGSDSLTVTVLPGAVSSCELYPISLHVDVLNGAAPGDVIDHIFNGRQPGNFGWLTWAGDPSVPVLINSLTPAGDSHTYVNPDDPDDNVVSVGDWVYGRPGVANARNVRVALDALKSVDIVVPVWDVAEDHDDVTRYRIAGFAQVRLISYHLPEENRISVRFLGHVTCLESTSEGPIGGSDAVETIVGAHSLFLPHLSRGSQ
jgi:PKD repeat protein